SLFRVRLLSCTSSSLGDFFLPIALFAFLPLLCHIVSLPSVCLSLSLINLS
ncbi:hypothetical protein CSUI_006838, partial [Cystoisospora suis]